MVGIEIGEITFKRYATFANKVEDFMKLKMGIKDIRLENIKYSFGLEYDHYLKSEVKLHQNTLVKYIQYLNRVLDYAVKYEWLDKNVLFGYKCRSKKPNVSTLPLMSCKELWTKRFGLSDCRKFGIVLCSVAIQGMLTKMPLNLHLITLVPASTAINGFILPGKKMIILVMCHYWIKPWKSLKSMLIIRIVSLKTDCCR
ncbi:MAG: phage integrase SAM-like domain-containing protein [Saprospiraceae bacterium]|nr:phage integrase SAM-like domain-containing protein [Saprospiraceae bacterium]